MIFVVDRAREGIVALLMPSHMRIICKQSALDLLHELYVSTLTLFAHDMMDLGCINPNYQWWSTSSMHFPH